MLPLSDSPSVWGVLARGEGGLWRREGPRGAMTAMLIPERDLYSHRLDSHHSQRSKGGWTEGTGAAALEVFGV